MKTVSPISFNFNKLEVTFERNGKKLTLVGGLETGLCKMIIREKLQRLLKNKLMQVAQLFSIHAIEEMEGMQEYAGEMKVTVSCQPQATWQVHEFDSLNMLLKEFEDLFADPTTLPPSQICDHSIPLKSNAEPVNVRSY